MAIVSGSAMGSFRGRLGNSVGYMLNGQNVVRHLPKKSAKNKRGSDSQRASRSKFTKMQSFLQPLLHFIRIGFNMEGRSRQMSAHNAAKSYNMLNAFNEEGEIDYSQVLLSFGDLDGAVDASVVQDDAGFHFSWTYRVGTGPLRLNDQVMLLAYHPDRNHDFVEMMYSGARRRAGQETLIDLTFKKGQEVHTWIAFISDDRQRISKSTYVGMIVKA
jgi:hypothetical protein